MLSPAAPLPSSPVRSCMDVLLKPLTSQLGRRRRLRRYRIVRTLGVRDGRGLRSGRTSRRADASPLKVMSQRLDRTLTASASCARPAAAAISHLRHRLHLGTEEIGGPTVIGWSWSGPARWGNASKRAARCPWRKRSTDAPGHRWSRDSRGRGHHCTADNQAGQLLRGHGRHG